MAAALQRAQHAYGSGKLQEARAVLRKLLQGGGAAAPALHLLGLVEQQLGDRTAAAQAFAHGASLPDAGEQIYLAWCELYASSGEFDTAEQVLRKGISRSPLEKALLRRYAQLKREADDRYGAALVFNHMLANWPDDAETLAARALVELERGGDAREPYRQALAASPRTRSLLLGLAAAQAAAGDAEGAVTTLRAEAGRGEVWLEGLRALARLRWDGGEKAGFTADFDRATRKHPKAIGLWASYVGVLLSGLHYERALEVIRRARGSAGDHALFDMMEAQALAETGRLEAAEAVFLRIGAITDPSFATVRMRALLRTGRALEAARIGETFIAATGFTAIWPLLGLAWRATEDERWQWLERHEETVSVVDLGFSEGELDELAQLLRRLHASHAYPYDQSARGGTQTSGNLFNRTDPPIARLRAAIRGAVREFIAALPAIDPSHPFLGRGRGNFRFAGSWSIRLLNSGYHLSHVHPAGWISSAFYVALPDCAGDGSDPNAGWLSLGQSPPELGLGLPPLRLVEPRRGRLVLFPSIMWHGTVPFPAGERLTVAFDVVPLQG